MNDQSPENNPETKDQAEGLQKLREKFPDHLIGKLPKPTKKQTADVKQDYRKGIRCKICGGWHHKDVVHLDYVGHASATDRLLDADIKWTWEPLALDDNNLPKFDKDGGLWIKLKVCDMTRLGYGSADGKTGGNAIKEAIGDAIRNAGMRFGIALDLWCKEDLHQGDDDAEKGATQPQKPTEPILAKEDFVERVDILKDVKAIEAWEGAHLARAESALNKADYEWFKSYIAQLKDCFITVICPQTNKDIPLEECKLATECSQTCKQYKEAMKG